MTRSELVEYIKRKCGNEVLNFELTDAMIGDCIDDALDEIRPWYSVFFFLTLQVPSDGSCIELYDYNILDVIKVYNADIGQSSSSDKGSTSNDIFSTLGMYGSFYPTGYADQLKYALRSPNLRTAVKNYAKAYRSCFYGSLANIMRDRLQSMLMPEAAWKFIDGKLYIDPGITSANGMVTIEYTPKVIEVEDVDSNNNTDGKYLKYLKDLSVAFAELLQSKILGKYTVAGSPVTVNSDHMSKQANAEINRIRTELRTISNRSYIN